MSIDIYAIPTREPCLFIQMLAKHIGVELNVKALDYDKQDHMSPSYSKMSPLHMVPTIDDGGFILYESSAICYYLLNKYAPESPIYPKEVQKRAQVDQILSLVSSFIQPVASSYIRTAIVRRKKLVGDELSAFEDRVLKPLQDIVSDKMFVVGNALTVADIRLVSIMMCFVPLSVVDKTKFAKLVSYYNSLSGQLPCFAQVLGSMVEERSKEWESYE
ncbi:glutathione S-transferase 1-like [Haemaphysalis longicornis]